MEILPSTKIHPVISSTTPYKLAEIIRDTYPNLFYLKETKPCSTKKQKDSMGWAAMIGVIAAMGSYAATGQLIPGVW